MWRRGRWRSVSFYLWRFLLVHAFRGHGFFLRAGNGANRRDNDSAFGGRGSNSARLCAASGRHREVRNGIGEIAEGQAGRNHRAQSGIAGGRVRRWGRPAQGLGAAAAGSGAAVYEFHTDEKLHRDAEEKRGAIFEGPCAMADGGVTGSGAAIFGNSERGSAADFALIPE